MVNDELSMIMPGTHFEVLGIFFAPDMYPANLAGAPWRLDLLLLPFLPSREEKEVGDRGQSPLKEARP